MNEPSNPFVIAAANSSGAIQVAQSKEAQQIQAQLVVAKRFPRDQHAAFQRIMQACQRRGLAEEATYVYSRGGTTISGASIRLLEVVAQQWGNFKSGIVELDNDNGESRVEAFAWDLETNAYDSKTFTVRHERYSKDSGVTKLTDPRDQYEHVANFSARRKRACMEAVIPRDIIDAAIEQCDQTLKAGHKEPIADRTRKMVSAFADYGVTVEMIEKRIQHKLDAIIEQELVVLRKIFVSLKDGMSKREDWFDLNAAEISRPKFETTAEPKSDEKELAAQGLAPAQAPEQPAKRGRPKKTDVAKQTQSSATPESPPTQPAPQPAAASPAAAGTAAQVESAPARADLFESDAYKQLRTCMTQSGITDAELILLCRQRGLMTEQHVELLQLSDAALTDLVDLWTTVAGQIRVERRKAQTK